MNYIEMANEEGYKNKKNNFKDGGPFGAVIVKNNRIIAKARNKVLKNNDPTAHAEILVIRKACRKLKTHDLSECILYSSCEPCPMCLSAIIWANIKEVFYGNTKKDADNIGFRDDMIYEFIKGNNKILNLTQINRDKTIQLFNDYENNINTY